MKTHFTNKCRGKPRISGVLSEDNSKTSSKSVKKLYVRINKLEKKTDNLSHKLEQSRKRCRRHINLDCLDSDSE